MLCNIVIYIDAMIMPDCNAAACRTMAVCKSLLALGMKPVVIGLENRDRNIPILETRRVYSGVDCYSVKYPATALEWLSRMTTIKPFVEVMRHYGIENIKALIAMDYESFALMRLKRFCSAGGIRLIADNVEWYDKSMLSFPKNVIKNLDTALRMQYIYPNLDYMITISRYLRSYYEAMVPHITEIPGTIDESDKKWQLGNFMGNDIFTIGYAGHPGLKCDKERADWLIQSVCELNEEGIPCKLRMAGFPEEVIRNFAPGLCKLKFYGTRIKILGKIPHSACLQMLASSDFSAVIREDKRVTRAGFPTKLSESFGCKTPVITTPSSNIADYVKPEYNNGFLIPQFSYDSLKETIRKIAVMPKPEIKSMHANLYNPLRYDLFTQKLKEIVVD